MLKYAIVLKNHIPLRQKVTVFDKKLGKIDCFCKRVKFTKYRKTLASGFLISYGKIVQQHNIFVLEDVEYLYTVPLGRILGNIHSLEFVHHVLELCYYFLPWHQPLEDMFKLLLNLYSVPETLNDDEYRRWILGFLCCFFKNLSIYPLDLAQYQDDIITLISKINSSKVGVECLSIKDDRTYKLIKKWLYGCISTHSYSGDLKTLRFIKLL